MNLENIGDSAELRRYVAVAARQLQLENAGIPARNALTAATAQEEQLKNPISILKASGEALAVNGIAIKGK